MQAWWWHGASALGVLGTVGQRATAVPCGIGRYLVGVTAYPCVVVGAVLMLACSSHGQGFPGRRGRIGSRSSGERQF